MRLLLASLLAISAAAASLHAQTPADTRFPVLPPAVEAGTDSVFLDLDRTDSPGCAAGVVIDGVLAFADGWGSANLDHELPITPETVFYMGSVSKQFTAAAVALAARQGHLTLDDDVRRWFPELPDYGDTIRVRHLIHHTSGIRDYLTLLGFAGTYEGASDEQIIRLLARQRALNFPPGERELYSNSGYFLLSELIERATGMTLPEYARREFFVPLGMRNSHFHDDPNHIVRYRATGYAPADGGFRMNHAWAFSQVG
ncbi:MAG: serine hydrolase domain-containing protein, partial [Gemmatimonadota bacterium]